MNDDNILEEFAAHINKSAQVMTSPPPALPTMPGQAPTLIPQGNDAQATPTTPMQTASTGQSAPRVATTGVLSATETPAQQAKAPERAKPIKNIA